MAIFDFIKDAGKKLLGLGDAPSASTDIEAKIKEHLQQLNLGIKDPVVKVSGDKVSIDGQANSQEEMEKAILAVGNVHGIAQVESKIASPQAAEPKFYTVKQGDTLSKIAKEQYGNANAYQQIFEANRPLLKDPDEIYPGQKLRIPEKQAAAA